MPKIAMCKSRTCPARSFCLRHQAKPDHEQTYQNFTWAIGCIAKIPGPRTEFSAIESCDYFLPMTEVDRLLNRV